MTYGSMYPGRSHVGSEELAPSRRGANSRRNDRLAVLLLAVVALAPVPFASNRPFLWAAWACVIGLACLLYLAALSAAGRRLSVPLAALRIPIALWAVFCLFAFWQALPAHPVWPGFAFPSAAGELYQSTHASLAPGATLLAAIRSVSYGLFFFLVVQVSTNERRRAFLLGASLLVAAGHAAYALLALFQFGDTILFLPKWGYPGSATGTFVNRNSFATFLAFGAVVAASLVFAPPRTAGAGRPAPETSFARVLALVVLLLLAATLVATQSRMGVLAAVCGLVVTAAIAARGRLGATSRGGALLVAAAVTAIGVLYGDDLIARFGSLREAAEGRSALYQQTLAMIEARPLLGYGGDSFELAYPLFHQPPVPTDLLWDKAHSTYLALWAEYGIVAGSLPILALCVVAGSICRAAWRSGGSVATAMVAAIGVVVVAAVHSTVDFSLEIQANAFFFLLLLGIGYGAAQGRSAKARAGKGQEA